MICQKIFLNSLCALSFLLFTLAAFPLMGCQKSSKENIPQARANEASEKQSNSVEKEQSESAKSPENDPYQQSFVQATRSEPPLEWQPVEKTLAGKSVGKLYETVKNSWDSIKLSGNDHHLKSFVAVFQTDLGDIEITLRPDLAPNHVRNFIALIRAEYYDGLVFERCMSEEAAPGASDKFDYVEAGCPVGTGDPRFNSLGYWLKPEISKDSRHEVGTVGACREAEADTAACKFYISLSKAPYLDDNYTVFGSVTKGLDVVHKIFRQPVKMDGPEGDGHPIKPVVIKKALIKTGGDS